MIIIYSTAGGMNAVIKTDTAQFIVLIIGTASLTYYLIHSAKDDYDKQYNTNPSQVLKYS